MVQRSPGSTKNKSTAPPKPFDRDRGGAALANRLERVAVREMLPSAPDVVTLAAPQTYPCLPIVLLSCEYVNLGGDHD